MQGCVCLKVVAIQSVTTFQNALMDYYYFTVCIPRFRQTPNLLNCRNQVDNVLILRLLDFVRCPLTVDSWRT